MMICFQPILSSFLSEFNLVFLVHICAKPRKISRGLISII